MFSLSFLHATESFPGRVQRLGEDFVPGLQSCAGTLEGDRLCCSGLVSMKLTLAGLTQLKHTLAQ